MTAASRPLTSGPRTFFACSGRADGAEEPVGRGGVGDLPRHGRIDRERLVDGAGDGVAGERFDGRQVERLHAAVDALDRVDRPRAP